MNQASVFQTTHNTSVDWFDNCFGQLSTFDNSKCIRKKLEKSQESKDERQCIFKILNAVLVERFF